MAVEVSNKILSVPSTTISVANVRQANGAELDAIARYRRMTNYLAAAQSISKGMCCYGNL